MKDIPNNSFIYHSLRLIAPRDTNVGLGPSSGPLHFVLDLGTPHVEPVTPDAFSLAIFDSAGVGIPTSFFDVFVQIDLTTPLTVATYASDPTQAPPSCLQCPGITISAPVVQPTTAIPEPGTLLLAGSGLAAVRRCRNKLGGYAPPTT